MNNRDAVSFALGGVCVGFFLGLVSGWWSYAPTQLQKNVWDNYQHRQESDLKNIKPSEPDCSYFKGLNCEKLVIRDEHGAEKVVIDKFGVRIYGTGVGKEVGTAIFANQITIRNPRMGGVNAELSVDEKKGGSLILSDRDGDNQTILRSKP